MNTEVDTEILRAKGLRVTAPRLAVLAVIREGHHMTADNVADAVGKRLGSISKQAVYDVLAVLTQAHIIRKVVIEGRGSWYELESGDNHHHVMCLSCGKFEDVPCVTGLAPCLDPPVDRGYIIEVADVIYRGLCPACQQKKKNPLKGS